jgi:hypothetical protein
MRVQRRPGEFLAALKRVAPPPPPQLEVRAKVELHSLNATEHNGKHGDRPAEPFRRD